MKMREYNISHLRDKLIIEVPEYKRDPHGGYEVVWKKAQEIWADISPRYVYRSDYRKNLGQVLQYKITARSDPILKHNVRLKYGEKNLAITSILNHPYDERFINILAKEEHDNSDYAI